MTDITNDAYGIPEKAAYDAIKKMLHPGILGKFRNAISADKARKTEALSLRNAKITNLDFLRYFPNLKTLIIYSSALCNLSGLQHTPNVTAINIGSHWPGETDLSPLSQCLELEELDLSLTGEKYTSETYITSKVRVYGLNALGKLHKVKYLGLSGMGITDLGGITGMENLEDIDLSYNPIKNLTPLTALKKVQEIDLTACGLKDITDLGQIESLIFLHLEANEINDFAPLTSLKNLKELEAEDNGLNDREIEKWQTAFKHVPEAYF